MTQAQSLVNEIAGKVHDLSLDLRPSMLDDQGLLAALVSHFMRYTEQTQIEVDFRHDGLDRRFHLDLEVASYRVVQEALTNVARHARVGAVHVRLWAVPESLNIQVEDEGCGFDLQASEHSRGISGMKERVMLLGGSLTVESTPGEGTCLSAVLPQDGATEKRLRQRYEHLAG